VYGCNESKDSLGRQSILNLLNSSLQERLLTLLLPGKFYLDMLETPGKFLVICSASFKKSPKIDFFSQLFEKNNTYELTPIV
jgi:hypothetical protein